MDSERRGERSGRVSVMCVLCFVARTWRWYVVFRRSSAVVWGCSVRAESESGKSPKMERRASALVPVETGLKRSLGSNLAGWDGGGGRVSKLYGCVVENGRVMGFDRFMRAAQLVQREREGMRRSSGWLMVVIARVAVALGSGHTIWSRL